MQSVHIDSVDRRILDLLQSQPGINAAAIGEKIGLSPEDFDVVESNEAFAVFPEPNAGRHCDFSFLEQNLGERHGPKMPERFRHRRPCEHRRRRRGDVPTCIAHRVDQRITAAAIDAAANLLSRREHARRELRQKLARKGFSDAVLDEALEVAKVGFCVYVYVSFSLLLLIQHSLARERHRAYV